MGPQTPRADLRLVPAALTAWGVTAAGIAWDAGPALAALCAAVGVGWWALRRHAGAGHPEFTAATAAVLATAVVGAGFGLAVGLRTDAVHNHPIGHRFGSTAQVTVRATESPRRVGGARLMFRADLLRVDGRETAGAVVVFASAAEFGTLRLTPA